MERAVEWFALVTCAVAGLSHILQPRAWVDVFDRLHRLGKPGAFVNGALSLLPGAAFVAAHPVWSWPRGALTLFGVALVLKGSVCLMAPGIALRSMAKAGVGDGRSFVAGGAFLLALVALIGYGMWAG